MHSAPLELWASPEPTVARIDATTVRDQLAETGPRRPARRRGTDRRASAPARRGRRCCGNGWRPHDPRERDFREPARRLEALRACGVEPIVTLLHHGSGPAYTDLLDPAFPLSSPTSPRRPRGVPVGPALDADQRAADDGALLDPLRRLVSEHARRSRLRPRDGQSDLGAMQAAMRRIRSVIPGAEFVITEDLQRFAAGDAGAASTSRSCASGCSSRSSSSPAGSAAITRWPMFLTARCGVNALELAMMQRDATPSRTWSRSTTTRTRSAISSRSRPAPPTSRRSTSPANRRRRSVRCCAPRPSGCACRWPSAKSTFTRRPRSACAGSPSTSPTSKRCGPTASTCARSARGPRSAWSTGIRSCGNAPGLPKTASTPLPVRTARPQPTAVADALRELAATGAIDDGGVRGWWEREDRMRPLDELVAMRDAGIPEGDHLRTTDEAPA